MPADAQRPDNVESAKIGQRVAQQHCGGCHAIEATGISPNPKSPPFPLIADALLESETDGLVAYIIRASRKWTPSP